MASDRDAQALHLVERNALDRSGRSFAPIQPTSGTRARRAFLLWAQAASSRSSEKSIKCEAFEIPDHFPRIGGMDFGRDHPFAAVEIAWDREQDVIYVIKANRLREATPVVHAGAIRSWGTALPWAWPRDGRRETLEGAGIALAAQCTAQGLIMLYQLAQFEDK